MLVFTNPPRFVFSKKETTAIENIIDRLSPKMQQAIRRAALTAQGRVNLERLSRMLEAGHVNQAVRQLDVDRFTTSDMAEASKVIIEARRAGMLAGAVHVPGWTFNATNPMAILAAERQAAALVTAVNAETKLMVRDLIMRAYREQVTVQGTAMMIRDIIGLNERQATALFNFRSGLVRDGLSASVVESKTAKYGDKLFRQRALTIAQTEIHRASSAGQHDLWREAVRDGRINPATARRHWITNLDACPWCEQVAAMNGNGVVIDGQYQTPEGIMIDGPEDSHVSCRCSERLEAA